MYSIVPHPAPGRLPLLPPPSGSHKQEVHLEALMHRCELGRTWHANTAYIENKMLACLFCCSCWRLGVNHFPSLCAALHAGCAIENHVA
jgi:hypothetical protein